MMIGKRKEGLSKLVLVLALAVVVASGSAIYFASIALISHTTQNTNSGSTNDKISIESLSVASSTSNLTATVNVDNSSALTKMSLFINGSLVGSYNYNQNSAGYCCMRMMRYWTNGTFSFFFTATPYYMPMMGRWNWGCCMMGGRYYGSFVITMMATFADGSATNATAVIVPNQQGTSWGCC